MDANKFFSVPYTFAHERKIALLKTLQTESCETKQEELMVEKATEGRWLALLCMLFSNNGVIDTKKQGMSRYVMRELGFAKAEAYSRFIEDCIASDLLDDAFYREFGHLVNRGVCDQIEYKRMCEERAAAAGRASGEARRKKAAKKAEEACLTS